jgi:hypothetical protein
VIGRRALTLDAQPYPLQYRLRLAQHLVVPEATPAEAAAGEVAVPLGVAFGLPGMLAAIEFDDQEVRQAAKIDDARPRRLLPLELQTEQAMPAQAVPGGAPPRSSRRAVGGAFVRHDEASLLRFAAKSLLRLGPRTYRSAAILRDARTCLSPNRGREAAVLLE